MLSSLFLCIAPAFLVKYRGYFPVQLSIDHIIDGSGAIASSQHLERPNGGRRCPPVFSEREGVDRRLLSFWLSFSPPFQYTSRLGHPRLSIS
jgi:hypothetical protein